MSRLLFAAARGARIEKPYRDHPVIWVETKFVLTTIGHLNRIHPADEHLQYGPISTALRGVALTGECDRVDIPYFTFLMEREGNYWESTEDQRRVFCLILAECLADEGM